MPKSTAAKLKYMSAYESSPKEVEKRVERNRARRHAIADGKVRVGDGNDIDHKKMLDLGGSGKDSNTRVVPAAKNRGWRAQKPFAYGKGKK